MEDAAEFKRASHAVWETMAPGWDDRHTFFEATARPVTERMLERLDATSGETILDLAAGTGVVGFAASALVGSSGRVIVSDFSQSMVEAARRQADELGLDNVDCEVLDAEHLDLRDASVDAVVCRWGYMLMAHPERAFAETRRVLRRGGRVSCAVFAGAEQNLWAGLPSRILVEHGHIQPPEASTPGILALANHDRLRRLFTEAGFSEPRIEEIAFAWHFRDFDDYWQFLVDVAGAIATVLRRLESEELQHVRAQLADQMTPFAAADGLTLPAASLVASSA